MVRYAIPLMAAAALAAAAPARAQEAPRTEPLAVGATAPDFAIPGGTRYGVLRDPVRLGDFRGKTVVLAFFFRARSSG